MSSVHLEEATGPSLGPVVLDIGGLFGAAVIRAPADLERLEIEIRREGTPWDGTHVAVRSRPGAGAPVFAAVFGHLEEATYELRLRGRPHNPTVHRVEVVGGEVCHTDWPLAAVGSI